VALTNPLFGLDPFFNWCGEFWVRRFGSASRGATGIPKRVIGSMRNGFVAGKCCGT